jgi:hypothetical protein
MFLHYRGRFWLSPDNVPYRHFAHTRRVLA